MKPAPFTIRVTNEFKGKSGTITHHAAMIVEGMEGCSVPDIIQALTVMDKVRSPDAKQWNPPGWIKHFAGFGKKGADPRTGGWIEIVHEGEVVSSSESFNDLLT